MSNNIQPVEKLQQKTQGYRKENARPSSPWWRRFSRFRRFFNRRQQRKVASEAPGAVKGTSKLQTAGVIDVVSTGTLNSQTVKPKVNSFRRVEDDFLCASPETRRRRLEELKREKERKKWDDLQKEIIEVMGDDEELSIAIESPKHIPQISKPSLEPEVTVQKQETEEKTTLPMESNVADPADKPNKKRGKLSEAFRLARLCKRAKKTVTPKKMVDAEAQTLNRKISDVATMTRVFELEDKAVNTTKVKTLSKCVQAERVPRCFNSIDNVAASLTVDTQQSAVYDKLTVYKNNLNFNDGLENESFENFRKNEDIEELEYFSKYWERATVTARDVTKQDKETVADFLGSNDSDDDASDEYDIDDSPLTNIDQHLNSIITLSSCLIQQVEKTRRDWAKVCQSPVPDCFGLHRGEVLDLIASKVRQESSRRMEMVSYNLQKITKVQELVEDVRLDQERYMQRLKDICCIQARKRPSKTRNHGKKNHKSCDQAREFKIRMSKSNGQMTPIMEVEEMG